MSLWPFSKKNNTANYYFGLFLKAENGIGMIIERRGEDFVVKEVERFNYSNGWEHLTEDVDEVLFKLESTTKLHLKECIVFVYSHLVDQMSKEIRPVYLQKLKDIFKNLELKALGYIECYEAVASFLREREQMPPTAVLIEIDSSDLSVFVYKGGKIVFSKTQSATDNIIEDLSSVFAEMHGVLLPSRIIIYNSKDLDESSTKIVTHRWSEDLFVQPPRVEIIKESEVFEGLVRVFQEQLAQDNRNFETMQSAPDKEEKKEEEPAGFVIGQDIESQPKPEKKSFNLAGPVITNVKNILSRIKKLHFPLPVLAVIGLAFIFSGLFLNEYLFHKASITVFVPSENIKKTLVAGETDLKIQVATDTADFTSSVSTTGKRSVGDKAKGTVSVHNFDDSLRTFSKGTQISADGINFTLDQDVKVASASEVIVSGNLVKQPGKGQSSVTATDIGEQSNLAKGKRFTIDNLSTSLFFAINENAFSGGSKRDVKTVAKADLQSLQSDVLAKAKKQQSPRVGKVIGNESKVIDALTSVSVTESKYSKEVGEEATEVTLSAKTATVYYFYRTSEMTDYLLSMLKQDIPSGMLVDRKNLSSKITKSEKKGNKIILTISISAKALKEISSDSLLKELVAKNEGSLQSDLKKSFDIQGYEVKIQSPLWFFKHTLPFFRKNIQVEISSL